MSGRIQIKRVKLDELGHVQPHHDPCLTYWNTHGCDLEAGHEGDHVCCPNGYTLYDPDRNDVLRCDGPCSVLSQDGHIRVTNECTYSD